MNLKHVARVIAWIAIVSPCALACELDTIVAEKPTAGEESGRAVALHDDVLAVGAPNFGIGNVKIFRNVRGAWIEEQVVSASDGFANDRFGAALALDDDLLFVGAPSQFPSGVPQAGAVYVFEHDGRSWNEIQTIAAADPGNNDNFGSAISFDGTSLLVGSPNDFDATVGAISGSAYVFTETAGTWTQQDKLLPPDGAFGDDFGFSVAIDGEVALIGAPEKDTLDDLEGAAYVYTFDSGTSTWDFDQQLLSSDVEAKDRFGSAVGLSAEVAIVGAYNEGNTGVFQPDGPGAAYVFEFDGFGWKEVTKLTASDGELADAFGRTARIFAEDRILIGAPFDDDQGGNAGAVYVFGLDLEAGWIEERKLTAALGSGGDQLGSSIASHGESALIGAPLQDGACPTDVDCDAGAAVLFQIIGIDDDADGIPDACDNCPGVTNGDQTDTDHDGLGDLCDDDDDNDGILDESDNCPTKFNPDQSDFNGNGIGDDCEINACQEQKLFAADADPLDGFGEHLQIQNDRAVYGAWNDELDATPGQFALGSAYVFEFIDGMWQEEQKLFASDGSSEDRFGHDVAIDGDVIAISAVGSDEACPGAMFCNSGSAYVFRLKDGEWIEEQQILGDPPTPSDSFATSIAVSGDVIASGTPGNDEPGASDTGAVWVHRYNGSEWVPEQKLIQSVPEGFSVMGIELAMQGDTIMAGSRPYDTMGIVSAGAVFVYEYDGKSWNETQILHASDITFGDFFGESVAIDGDVAVVGAIFSDDANPGDVLCNSGSAYVFRKVGGTWIEEQKLTASDATCDDEFGGAVAVSGDIVIVGTFKNDDACPENPDCTSGSAYIFQFNGKEWIETAKVTASDAGAGDHFGIDVGVSGDRAMIGSYLDDDAGNGAGAVYYFGATDDACDPACAEDLDASGDVGFSDLLQLLAAWGDCPAKSECPADLDASGTVGFNDLLLLLNAWGPCT